MSPSQNGSRTDRIIALADATGSVSAVGIALASYVQAFLDYSLFMPLTSKKKQPFIIDENLGDALKPYLPGDPRPTVECGMRKGTKDFPFLRPMPA